MNYQNYISEIDDFCQAYTDYLELKRLALDLTVCDRSLFNNPILLIYVWTSTHIDEISSHLPVRK